MAKRPKKADAPADPPKDRTEDRHVSGFMIRLPEAFRQQLDVYRDQQFRRHRYRPPRTLLVQQALEKFLEEQGLWPPPADAP